MSQFYVNPNEIAGKISSFILEELETSKMKPDTAQTIRRFINNCSIKLQRQFEDIINDELMTLKAREEKLENAEEIIKKAEELREQYPDPRARQAMVMYNDIVNRYVEDWKEFGIVAHTRISDEQAYRNAILSAGRIVAAYLGGKENEETK